MAKAALYQKYRSSTFDEMVGQEYVVRSIRNAVKENKVGHAYLFNGPRGTGKTSMARLLAKAVNCENHDIAPCGKCANCIAAAEGTHPDIVEINAANETHVEDIRDLIDRARLAPMMGEHKIYIIDEVHQLSSAASSALLKTLEEPPENVIFILATTDPQKLLPTIISRCQRFDFTKVRTDQIRDHLLEIAAKEKIEMEKNAAEMIAVLADGGMRDALSIMDQCAAYTSDHITEEAIDRIYGLATTEEKIGLIKDILNKDIASLLKRIRTYEEKGIDLSRFTDSLIEILKDCVIFLSTHTGSLLKVLNTEQAGDLTAMADTGRFMRMCETLVDTKDRYKTAISASECFEVIALSLTIETQPTVVVQEAPKTKTEQPEVKKEPEQPKVEIREQNALPTETIVALLVTCTKQEKQDTETAFAKIKNSFYLENRKYISMINSSAVAAAGKDCVLLVCTSQAAANMINEPKNNEEMYFFIKDTLKVDKVPFAMTKKSYADAVNAFRTLHGTGNLPPGYQVTKPHREEIKEPTTEEKVLALFGAANVEVI
ncbi:MAG: DNA polymerase III subunit gamma/tau [Solobacterium sp.]|nr:DNA polymerase III subunit gamma/tau [Solobacterium sp.]